VASNEDKRKQSKQKQDTRPSSNKDKARKDVPSSASKLGRTSSASHRHSSLEQDAEPIPGPSPSQEGFEEDLLSKDWDFNAGLLEFSDEITPTDLNRMKVLLSGKNDDFLK